MKFPSPEEYAAMSPMEQSWWWIRFVGRHRTMDGMPISGWEMLSGDDVIRTVRQVVTFFNLPAPVLKESAETVARIVTNEDAEASELSYNLRILEKTGINNHDALTLCIVHELCHQALHDTRFLIFSNELWIHELACDMVAGAYAERYRLATNKYKWVVHAAEASPTHPSGKLREIAVDYGRANYSAVVSQPHACALDGLLQLLPSFVYAHMAELAEDWRTVRAQDWETTFANPPRPKPLNPEDLPDTNLLKQFLLKHRVSHSNEENNENHGQQPH